MAKKTTNSTPSKRAPVASLSEFDAAYLSPGARGMKSEGDGQFGAGLVSHVLRDFRRSLRS
jgi:hypothetical protein